MSDTTVIHSARLLGPDFIWDDAWLSYQNGTITGLGNTNPPDAHITINARGDWLLPGFVDLHNHGGGGHSVTEGEPAAVQAAATLHKSHGTTTMLASLTTAPLAEMTAACARLADLVDQKVIAGIHLEGPFLSHARCGAHNPHHLLRPDKTALQQLLAAGRGHVRQVSIAPELPGALDLIRLTVDNGAIAAIGHTDASYEETQTGIRAGARLATHLFNGCRPLHHREPGPIAALLENPDVIVEIIADGVHLHEALLPLIFAHCGPDRIALITDAMAAAGKGDGKYRLGSQPVTVKGGIAKLDDNTAIAGSTLTMDAALRRCVHVGLPMLDVVIALTRTPARLLGLCNHGILAQGARADLVLIDKELRARHVISAH